MIKQMLSEAGLAPFAVIGLVTFVAVFVGISLWAMTRKKRQINQWSNMPLEDGKSRDPILPKLELISTSTVDTPVKESCGKCEVCDCMNESVTTLTL